MAPFLYLVLILTLQEAGQPGCGASPPLESLPHLTRHELPHRAVCQLGFAPTSSSWPGGTLPSLPALFGDMLSFPHQSLPKTPHGATTTPRGGFQPPHWSSTHGVRVSPRHPTLQTPCVPAQPRHSTAPPAKPQHHAQASVGWVNIFPVTSRWPLVLWKKQTIW